MMVETYMVIASKIEMSIGKCWLTQYAWQTFGDEFIDFLQVHGLHLLNGLEKVSRHFG